MGDPERYRESEEVQKWQENDPIGIYRKYLNDEEIATDEELDEIDSKAEADIQSAIKFAESSPEPADEALFENVYAEG
jgi:pyruvate dehydrogenase E1 component alpha subunit